VKFDDRKEMIIRAATELFDSKGYHATSIEDICNEVGITRGTLYYYITGKEDLLHEIHDRYITAILAKAQEAISALDTQGAKEKLVALIRVHACIMRDYRKEITVFFREMDALGPENFRSIAEKRRIYRDLLTSVIREGIESGEFAPVDPRIASLALLGMLNWMYQWYRPDGRLSVDQIAEELISLVLHGLTPCVCKKISE